MKFTFLLVVASLGILGCTEQPQAVSNVQPSAASQPLAQDNPDLIKVGAAMPNLTLTTPEGGKLQLAQALKKKKALLLNFWFYT
jgi:PBP1b-binding outer membrane lipoprotein LpoB